MSELELDMRLPDLELLWIMSCVVLAGLILSPRQTSVVWSELLTLSIDKALELRDRCEERLADRKEVFRGGSDCEVDPGCVGGEVAEVQPAKGV